MCKVVRAFVFGGLMFRRVRQPTGTGVMGCVFVFERKAAAAALESVCERAQHRKASAERHDDPLGCEVLHTKHDRRADTIWSTMDNTVVATR